MAPLLYSFDASPPCRTVLMTAKALSLPLNIQEINLQKSEQFEDKFLKINPRHTLPTLIDDGITIVDSHPIVMYLADKYAKDDSLYPKDLKRRALVNERLFFDCEVAFAVVLQIVKPIRLEGVKTVPEEKKKAAHVVYQLIETFLDGKKWVAGDTITIADLSFVSTITSLDIVVPLEGKYPNIQAWLGRCKGLPFYSANEKGLQDLKDLINKLLTS